MQTNKYRLILLLAPLLFFLHDLEEILRMPAFLAANADRLPAIYANITKSQFTLAIAILTTFTLAVAIPAAHRLAPCMAMTIYAFIVAARLANVFIHLFQVVFFRNLTPGAYTVLFLVLPHISSAAASPAQKKPHHPPSAPRRPDSGVAPARPHCSSAPVLGVGG